MKIVWIMLCLLLPAAALAAEAHKGCEIGGCSNEFCTEAGDHQVSACMWRAEYACYKQFSVCEKQIDGECGWTMNEKLSQCLQENGHSLAPILKGIDSAP